MVVLQRESAKESDIRYMRLEIQGLSIVAQP